jgi:SPP1 family phage portal protein
MLDELNLNQSHYQKLQNYYEGNHTFIQFKDFGDTTQPQNRVIINYPKKIVNFLLGYYLGKPITYSSNLENNEFLSKIETYFKGWEPLHNVRLNKKAQIHGKAYEVVYIDNQGQFKCASFSPLEMIVLTDNTVENRVLIAIRKYKKQYDNNEYIDIYTDKEIITYQLNLSNLLEINRINNIFGECPVFELKNNEECKGDFEEHISLIDMYDLVNSLNVNELEYFRNCYLALTGVEGTDDSELQKMKTNRILKMPKESEAKFLIKEIDADFIEKVLDRIEREIIQQANIAILSTAQIQSNVSGIALKVKLQETENIISVNEQYLRSLIYNRLKFFAKYLKIKENKNYDWTSIELVFTRNVPTNILEWSQIIQNLSGHVSNETLIQQIPFVTSVELEQKRLNAEIGKDMTPEEIQKLLQQHLQQS